MKYSITPQNVAKSISSIRKDKYRIVADVCCGAGGNAAQFSADKDFVIAIDLERERVEMTRHNVKIQSNCLIDVIQGDARHICFRDTKVDMIFMSPPWGGPDYNKSSFRLSHLQPAPFDSLMNHYLPQSFHFALFLPKSTSYKDLFQAAKNVSTGPFARQFGPRRLCLQVHLDGSMAAAGDSNDLTQEFDSLDSIIRHDWVTSGEIDEFLLDENNEIRIPPSKYQIFLHPPDYLTANGSKSKGDPVRTNEKWSMRVIGITVHFLSEGKYSEVDVLKSFSSARLPYGCLPKMQQSDLKILDSFLNFVQGINQLSDETAENGEQESWSKPADLLSCPMIINLVRFYEVSGNQKSAKGVNSLQMQSKSLLHRIANVRFRLGLSHKPGGNRARKVFEWNADQIYRERESGNFQEKKRKCDFETFKDHNPKRLKFQDESNKKEQNKSNQTEVKLNPVRGGLSFYSSSIPQQVINMQPQYIPPITSPNVQLHQILSKRDYEDL
eukprot:GDKJ01056720.1.p1 GENE.GDKJ01056720.1~~GDKJ01056720.1.p1  ORF type:complete len:551 (-),score=100.64 GDKJ01056720.1:6-1496(-)